MLAFAGTMTGAGFLLVALVAGHARGVVVMQPRHAGALVAPSDEAQLDSFGDPPRHVVDAPGTPPAPIEHSVPVYPARFLEGCSVADLDAMEEALTVAIAHAAPLYNQGDATGAAERYERAARSLESALPASCHAPVAALGERRASAAALPSSGARAWALHDAFEGLLDAIERSRVGGVGSL